MNDRRTITDQGLLLYFFVSRAVLFIPCCSLQKQARQETGPVEYPIKKAQAYAGGGGCRRALDVHFADNAAYSFSGSA